MLPFGEIHVLEDKILHLLLEQRGQNTRGASRARGPENRDRHDIRFLRNSEKKKKTTNTHTHRKKKRTEPKATRTLPPTEQIARTSEAKPRSSLESEIDAAT
jgi:hypothetical protein